MERKPQEIGHKKQVKIGIEEFCEDGNEDSSSQVCILNTPLSPQGWSRFYISTCFHALKYVG